MNRSKRAKWTDDDVSAGIRKRKRHGYSLNAGAVMSDDPPLYWAGYRYFGSWDNALQGAGVDPEKVRENRKLTQNRILEEVRGIRSKGGEVNAGAVAERDRSLFDTARKRFKGWDKVLIAVGDDPERVSKRPRWTPQLVLSDIRALEGVRRVTKLRKTHGALVIAAIRSFGSWAKAVRAAGRSYPKRKPRQRWPRKRIVEVIRSRARRGLSLMTTDVVKKHPGLPMAAQREYGSWKACIRAAGCTKLRQRQLQARGQGYKV